MRYHVIWNLVQLFGDNNIVMHWNSVINPSISNTKSYIAIQPLHTMTTIHPLQKQYPTHNDTNTSLTHNNNNTKRTPIHHYTEQYTTQNDSNTSIMLNKLIKNDISASLTQRNIQHKMTSIHALYKQHFIAQCGGLNDTPLSMPLVSVMSECVG